MIPPFYDSMIAKLIVWDSDRAAAIARAERALHETVIEGVPTTRDLALEVLASEPFRTGDYSTSTLEALRAVTRDDLEAPGAQAGALPALPVGSLRPGDRLAVRRRDRPVGARRSHRPSPSAPRSSTRASRRPRTAGPPTGSGAVERSALRVAVHELEHDEVPAEVAISEAVAFTKRYASDDGARLVNGILGRIQREEAA